ncbi:MAG: RsbRD N-terminal domain-containing protein [Spirochaetes bacterium]|nr:RsbRD N-terminal domain-containing protein [Spirochaetota bacterium]
MVHMNLILMLDTHAATLSEKWKEKVMKTACMKHYHDSFDKVIMRNENVYRMLSKWMQKESSKTEIGAFFVSIGQERFRMGFPLSEVNYALFLTKRVVRDHLMESAVLDSSLAISQAMDISMEINDFFFLGSFYLIKGYLEEMYIALRDKEKLPPNVLDKYLFDDFFFKSHSLSPDDFR